MFPCFGGDQWWPMNAAVGVFSAAPDQVGQALTAVAPASRSHSYASLSEALAGEGGFAVGFGADRILVGTKDNRTVAMSAAGPAADVVNWYAARAQYQAKCDFVGVEFVPRSPEVMPGAMFYAFHFAGDGSADLLDIRTSDQGGGWAFDRVALPQEAPREYEEPEFYAVRRKADRLPLDLLGRYLVAKGIPIDDASYLTGPVLVIPASDRKTRWTRIEQLREMRGYSVGGVPRTLSGAA